jgi:beta-glucanase (GH16 family)
MIKPKINLMKSQMPVDKIQPVADKCLIAILWVIMFCGSVFAQELLVNGDFESGSSGWTIYDGGVWSNYGSAALKAWATGEQWDVGFAFQRVQVTAGETYTFSAEVLNSSSEPLPGTGGTAFIKFEFFDETQTIINGPYGTLLDSIDGTAALNTWFPLSGSMTAPAGSATVNAILMVQNTGGGTSVAWFDNASLIGPDLDAINDPDYDNSRRVDFADFVKLAGVWHQTSSAYNLSGSNFVELEDLLLFANAWLDQITPYPGYELVWSDEFYGPGVNSQNWTHETGTRGDGWGNWEWQYYTDRTENCRIENGKLIIEARRENYGGMDYTSARIKTQNKQQFQYGRVEARIKMPAGGEGIWPAFWMLGDNTTSVGWPTCGELDIVEIMSDPYKALGTIHYANPSGDHASLGGDTSSAGNLSNDFHIYAVEWDETGIRWYRDDVNYYTASSWTSNAGAFPAPFNQPFFIILNVAVGAWWWDQDITDSTVSFPQQMQVDYVRVYQKTSP